MVLVDREIVSGEPRQRSDACRLRAFRVGSGAERVVVLANRTHVEPCRGTVVFVPPYGASLHEYCLLCVYFLKNGFNVLRFDGVNNVGLSAGTIERYSLGRLEDDLAAVMQACFSEDRVFGHACGPVSLLAQSLAFPVALKRSLVDSRIERIISLVGVVNVEDTVARVARISLDPYVKRLPDAPRYHRMFGYPTLAQEFVDDAISRHYFKFEDFMTDLRKSRFPIHLVVSDADEYVRFSDVLQCKPYCDRGSGDFLVISGISHMFGRSVSTAKRLATLAVQCAAGVPSGEVAVVAPRLTEAVEIASREAEFLNECERHLDMSNNMSSARFGRVVAP